MSSWSLFTSVSPPPDSCFLNSLLCSSLFSSYMFYPSCHFFFLFFLSFFFFRATPTAHGGSQARRLIGATAAGLHHSHNNTGSEPHLRPTPQLTAMPDPQPTERGQGSNPQPQRSQSDSFPLRHDGNSHSCHFNVCLSAGRASPGHLCGRRHLVA